MSKRAMTVGFLTAGLTVGAVASMISPAAAQGNPVGGQGNVYFYAGVDNSANGHGSAGRADGQATRITTFGDPGDMVYVGDFAGASTTTTNIVRRGNVYFQQDPAGSSATTNVFVYGNVDDVVLVGDWNGDGIDTLAVRRGNQYLVRNDFNSGVAQTTFNFGDAGDTILVGNWNGQTTASGPGQDGQVGTADDVTGKGDTLAVRRGNQYLVKNTLSTGIADYDFFYGDAGDKILVGDWSFPVVAANGNNGTVGQPAVAADGADQLAIARGNRYFFSGELPTSSANTYNPAAIRTFFYGDPSDTSFVANAGNGDSLAIRRVVTAPR